MNHHVRGLIIQGKEEDQLITKLSIPWNMAVPVVALVVVMALKVNQMMQIEKLSIPCKGTLVHRKYWQNYLT
ncbi:hypothetical protein D3C71_1912140 [compost metagenome]